MPTARNKSNSAARPARRVSRAKAENPSKLVQRLKRMAGHGSSTWVTYKSVSTEAKAHEVAGILESEGLRHYKIEKGKSGYEIKALREGIRALARKEKPDDFLSLVKRRLAAKPNPGTYTCIIGARKTEHNSFLEAHRHGVKEQAKGGVHSGFRVKHPDGTLAEYGRDGKRKNPGKAKNPADGAASLFEMFHGEPSEHESVITEDVHYHEYLGELGVLGGLKVRTVSDYDVTLEFIQDKANNPSTKKVKGWIDRRGKAVSGMAQSFAKTWLNPRGKGPVILCGNENHDTMYFRGGDQSVDLSAIHMKEFSDKDSIVIGEVWCVGYVTQKHFDDWQDMFYVHGLGDEDAHPKLGKKKDLWDDAKPPETLFGTGLLPTLIYDRMSKLLSLSGGVYKIEADGIID